MCYFNWESTIYNMYVQSKGWYTSAHKQTERHTYTCFDHNIASYYIIQIHRYLRIFMYIVLHLGIYKTQKKYRNMLAKWWALLICASVYRLDSLTQHYEQNMVLACPVISYIYRYYRHYLIIMACTYIYSIHILQFPLKYELPVFVQYTGCSQCIE